MQTPVIASATPVIASATKQSPNINPSTNAPSKTFFTHKKLFAYFCYTMNDSNKSALWNYLLQYFFSLFVYKAFPNNKYL